jgi:hypothetical protein
MKIMKRESMAPELDDLRRIVTSLRLGTDNQAATVLARLRLGETPENVAKSLPATAASPTISFQPPRYALSDHSTSWLQHVDNGSQLTGPGIYGHIWKWKESGVTH